MYILDLRLIIFESEFIPTANAWMAYWNYKTTSCQHRKPQPFAYCYSVFRDRKVIASQSETCQYQSIYKARRISEFELEFS